MFPEKTKRSLRRFRRRVASYRRHMLRRLHQSDDTMEVATPRLVSRIPTRQERRIDEAFRQDLNEVELA